MKENQMITIQVYSFYTHELASKIAAVKGNTEEHPNIIRQEIFDDKMSSDGFGVVATNAAREVVGRLRCIQSEDTPTLWYYGDLYVVPTYRSRGIARQMVEAAICHLSEMNASTLKCYVEPQNIPSIQLQMSLGFSQRVYEPFGSIDNQGQLMFVYDLPSRLSVIPATSGEAYFVRLMFVGNRDALGCGNISMKEWRELLGEENPDQKHFLICDGAMPVGYMKLQGLSGKDRAWLDMLFVAPKYHGQGIGTFAIAWAQAFAKDNHMTNLCVSVPKDNMAMQHLCRKLAYNENEDCFTKKL